MASPDAARAERRAARRIAVARIDFEAAAMFYHCLGGCAIMPETLALEAIIAVGPARDTPPPLDPGGREAVLDYAARRERELAGQSLYV